MNIRIARRSDNGVVVRKTYHSLDRSRQRFGHASTPFVNLGMAICHGEATGAVVQSGLGIVHLRRVRAEKTRIVDAVWMFIQEDPGIGRARVQEL